MNRERKRETAPRKWAKLPLLLAGIALAFLGALAAGDDLERLDQLANADPKAAIALAETMLAAATEPRRRLSILNIQAGACIWASENERAAALAEEAADLARSLDDAGELGDALYAQATALHRLHRYSEAYDKASLGLQTFARTGDRSGQAKSLIRLGSILGETGDNRRALEYLSRAQTLSRELSDEFLLADTLGIMTHIYYLEKDYANMLRSAQQAIDQNSKLGARRFIVTPLVNAGNALFMMGKLAEAEGYLRRALALARDEKDRANEMIASKFLAVVHLEKDDPVAALKEARLSLAIARELRDSRGIWGAAAELSRIHARRKEFRQAYLFREQADEAHESLRLKEATESINRSLQQLEIERKEAEIRLLRQQKEIDRLKMRQQKILGWFQLALALILLTATAITVRAYLAKRKANREINALNVRLEDLSRTDPLTQCLNRRGMMEKLEAEVRRFRRTRQPFALASGDIDDFKQVNDRFGHECGDKALRLVAGLMRSRLRETDDLARWGGEEFLLLMPLTGESGALKAAEEIRAAVADLPLEWRDQRIALTMTFGVGVYEGEESLEEMLNRIDQALYAGKRAGKNRVVFTPSPTRSANSPSDLQDDS